MLSRNIFKILLYFAAIILPKLLIHCGHYGRGRYGESNRSGTNQEKSDGPDGDPYLELFQLPHGLVCFHSP